MHPMKFLSFVRLFGERWQRGGSTRERPARKRRSRGPAKSPRLTVEALEERTLMSVVPNLPLPVITNATLSGSNAVSPNPNIGNFNNPSVSFDPINPQKMFATWTRNDPANGIVVGSGTYFI